MDARNGPAARDAPGSWRLPTATGEYVVGVAASGAGLVLLHWGAPGEAPPPLRTESTNVLTPADVEPLEYAVLGTRHVQRSELVADLGDGLVGALLRLEGRPDVERSGTAHMLTARLVEPTGTLAVRLVVATDQAHDVVRKHVVVENVSTDRTIALSRVFSGAFDLPVGPGAGVALLAGGWATEFTPMTAALPAGELSIGSRTGLTGHLYAPVVTVQRLGAGPDDEAFGVALAWSGSWRLSVDAVPHRGAVRVSAGVDDESTVVTLLPGERFVTPELLGVRSPHGPGGVSRRWHAFQRRALSRTTGPEHRPVVYNSWYATGFDVRPEHQARLADVAHDLGVEAFVVDDGWFAGRAGDHAGLGDWWPDPSTFPDGLGPLVDAVHPRMRFGLWVEPECVNPDSDLFRAHPDWVYRAGDRPLVTIRNQYVLDLGRPEVEAYLEDVLRTLLAERRITFLKWDMNRPVTDGGRPGDPHGRQWSVQHTRAYYRLMATLRRDFPHVTVEACSSGGGRVDNAVLALSDVVWTSDQTAPRARLAIQHGFLTAYPASTMSSWVTDHDDHGDDPCSFEFRFVVAMAGVLGIGADLLRWHPARRTRARGLVALHKRVRRTVHTGVVVPYGQPRDPYYALVFAAPDGGQAVVLAYARPSARGQLRVPVTGLDPRARYRLGHDGSVLSGRELATGVVVPFALAPDADVVVLDRVDR
ncbi:MAG: alpha-galactosidase [Kineosporiaceae bacterium]